MNSRLLARLDQEVALAADPREGACKRAERAAYLIRQGNIARGRTELSTVQEGNLRAPDPRVSSWANFAEAVLQQTIGNEAGAIDRLKRALAIAEAAQVHRVSALSAAWLAYVAYTRADLPMVIQYVETYLRTPPPFDQSALARVHLVLGQGFHFAGRYDIARTWYESARLAAVNVGDDLLISAILHNAAWLHLSCVRQGILSNSTMNTSPVSVRLAMESAESFDEISGIGGLNSFVPLLRASVCLLEERFEEALKIYDRFIEVGRQQGLGKNVPGFLAEKAYCQARIGQYNSAAATIAHALVDISPSDHTDDQALTHSRAAQVYALLDDLPASERESQFAEDYWRKFEGYQASMFVCFESLAGQTLRN